MKKTIALIFLVISCHTVSQRKLSFDRKVILYEITKNKNVSKDDFERGKYIFEQTIKQVKKKSFQFNYADYWNLAISFKLLNEDKSLINEAFNKAYALNPEDVCYFLNFFKSNKKKQYDEFVEIVPQINLIDCNNIAKRKPTKFDINTYCEKNNLNLNLVKLIHSVSENDQKYRGQDYKKNLIKQRKLDSLNLKIIDSLYKRHKTYIGKFLVGDKFSHIMWIVIQHSNLEKMENYLPILITAVKKDELNLVPLKMLIDRIYTIKYNYQIFGSQVGIDLTSKEIRKKVIAKYDLDDLNL